MRTRLATTSYDDVKMHTNKQKLRPECGSNGFSLRLKS